MNTKLHPLAGTVISGTHRLQDLIPAFLDTLAVVAPDHYAQLMTSSFGPIPAYVQDHGDSSDWWHSEDAHFLLEELIDVLTIEAPEGYYFGAHPGDGADFGYWQDEDLGDVPF